MADESGELDNEFDGFLAEMKPYMLKLPHKSGELMDTIYFAKVSVLTCCELFTILQFSRNSDSY